MRFELFTEWGQLPTGSAELFAQGERRSIFCSQTWFENLLEYEPQPLLLACVTEGETLLAMLPLTGSFDSRKGTQCYSLKHRYGADYSVLWAGQDPQQILRCLALGLRDAGINALLLEPVDQQDPQLYQLQLALQSVGYACEWRFRFYNWTYSVQGQSFNDYLAERPPRLRNTLKRKRRKLQREFDLHLELKIGEQVPDAMRDYYEVYQASWKAHEQYREFLDGMVARFSMRGWTRLGLLSIDGQVVAAQLWLVAHRKAYIFRLAYDQAWKTYSPGSLLTEYLVREVIDREQVQRIDFLVGNESYKQDWMSEPGERGVLGCVLANPVKPTRRRAHESLGWFFKRLAK